MTFKVTVYCHDRCEVTFEREFAKWRDAHGCAMKQLLVNNSVTILDDGRYDAMDKRMKEIADAFIDPKDADT